MVKYDWLKPLVWTAIFLACVGFWMGVILVILKWGVPLLKQ
jgi:hypothetical protein